MWTSHFAGTYTLMHCQHVGTHEGTPTHLDVCVADVSRVCAAIDSGNRIPGRRWARSAPSALFYDVVVLTLARDGRGFRREQGAGLTRQRIDINPIARRSPSSTQVAQRQVHDHADSRGVAQRQPDWSFNLKSTGLPV
ncbi:hypothetical protein AMELA_G00265020 [Ameiurus melas]|uniref:Uncharacterized protein n=1 Tax=Ameiurus melas TaxID=219545 RepID=A0A7J5ZTP8_AMEME|nr:hypothetical protein AMELA_G00265020 [Ameiurus melas]